MSFDCPEGTYAVPMRWMCERNHIFRELLFVWSRTFTKHVRNPLKGRETMRANTFAGGAGAALALLILLGSAGSALALPGTAEGRRACTPDVYRLCAGDIPNVRAITACLMRQKGNLSPACRAAMEQNGY